MERINDMKNLKAKKIIEFLAEQKYGCHVAEMARVLNMPRATIERHLSKLMDSDVVSSHYMGTALVYTLRGVKNEPKKV
ncbi:hypothetical protein LCGC14_0534700 [marine sediment metagenome]|uniref:HTH arsR-type domain-containing protein n=1 Tax=marine sediment metagenome TaxID=412755 RepID=A0A0F9RZ91_9ZZZZ